MKKQTISFLLSLIMLLNLLPVSALAAGPDSGSVGDRITWNLDRETGVLSFEGSGRMYREEQIFESGNVLWWRDGEAIREIRFDERIESIAGSLFSLVYYTSFTDMNRLRNVRSVRIPAGVVWIGDGAFAGCTRLEEITVLNPDCKIKEGMRTLGIPGLTVVVGYSGSTAERYAAEYGFEFRAIGCADGSHVFTDTVITPPTCTQDGVKESECVICHQTLREAIPAGHDYVISERLARTVYTCSRCGDSYVAGECVPLKLGANAEFTVNAGAYLCVSFTPEKTDLYSFSVGQDAARQAYGYEESYAQICDSTGKPVESRYNDAVLNAGETYYFRMGQVYDDALPVQAMVEVVHRFMITSSTVTCTEPGVVTNTCVYCGESFTRDDWPTGHNYVTTVDVAPTCTQNGRATQTCSRCGDSYTEILARAHQYVYDADLPWYRHAVCAVCGDEITSGTADPPAIELDKPVEAEFRPGSDFCVFRFTPDRDEFYTLVTDLYSGYGGEMYTAGGVPIGDTESKPLRISGTMEKGQTCYLVLEREFGPVSAFSATMQITHDYRSEITVPATCSSEGVRTNTCSFCGDSYTEAIPEAHEWALDLELPWYQHGICEFCGKEGEFGTRTPPALNLDEETAVRFDASVNAYFTFTPERTEVYGIRFPESYDAVITVFDPDGSMIDWSIGNSETELEAGQTCYIEVRSQDPRLQPSTLVMERLHSYRLIRIREPGCTEPGLEVGVCTYCGETVSNELEPRHLYDFDIGLPWYAHAVCQRCGEIYEWGNPTPPEITLDAVVIAGVNEDGDNDFFRFTPPRTGIYRFDFGDGASVRCSVYSGSGEYITGAVSDQTYNISRLTCPLHAGWTYYLSAGFLEPDHTGTFPLSIHFAEALDETELKPDQATEVTLDYLDASAFFRITPDQDGFYAFSSENAGDADPVAWLVDASGNQLVKGDDFFSENFNIRYPMKAGQTYYLVVQNIFGGPCCFNVRMQRVDSPYDAEALTPDRTQYVRISEPDEHKMYVFTPAESGSYSIFSESGGDTVCALYDDTLNLLGYSDDEETADFRLTTDLEAGKTYYFEISYFGSNTGVFPVTLRRDVNWSEPNYWWDGNKTVTADCYDQDSDGVWQWETAQVIRVVVKEPTYASAGEAVYIASFRNPLFQTQVRTEYIPRLTAPELPCDGTDCPGRQFADMPAKDHWAHDAIDWALVNGITTGTSAGRFSPDAGCTRAQVVTFLWRAAGEPAPRNSFDPFYDTDLDAYYYMAMLWALDAGITTGTSADSFSPDSTCTRAQIATFLWRYEGCPEPEKAASFRDVPAGAYYEKAVAWAAEQGVTTGTGDGQFSPDSTCTRAQVATFLYRYMCA